MKDGTRSVKPGRKLATRLGKPLYGYNRVTVPTTCPCGSGLVDAACCSLYLDGVPAPTALALMRSRYTAYVRGAIDYLVDTHDPRTRASIDVAAVTRWSRETTWSGLEIVATDRGGEDDDTGIVEFIASGVTAGKPFRQRERSRFRRVDGAWLYTDGDVRQGR